MLVYSSLPLLVCVLVILGSAGVSLPWYVHPHTTCIAYLTCVPCVYPGRSLPVLARHVHKHGKGKTPSLTVLPLRILYPLFYLLILCWAMRTVIDLVMSSKMFSAIPRLTNRTVARFPVFDTRMSTPFTEQHWFLSFPMFICTHASMIRLL